MHHILSGGITACFGNSSAPDCQNLQASPVHQPDQPLPIHSIYTSHSLGKAADVIKFTFQLFLLLHSPVGQKMQELECTYQQIQKQLLPHCSQTSERSSKKGSVPIFQHLIADIQHFLCKCNATRL